MSQSKHILVLGTDPKYLVNMRGPLMRALISRGHRVSAIAGAASDDLLAPLTKVGVRVFASPLERAGLNPISDASAIWQLRRQIKQIQPDVFFGYTIKPVSYGMLLARAMGVTRRTGMMPGLGYAFTSGEGRAAIRFAASKLLQAGIAQSHMMIFQNPDDRQSLIDLGIVKNLTQTALVNGSGVDMDIYAPKPLPDGPITFLMIARLLRDKGIYEYIEAARIVKAVHQDARFVLVGGLDPNPAGLKKAELDALMSGGIVDYRGELSDVRQAIGEAHVYVLPSYREGTPRTVLEAMAMRRPVITTDAPGCRETIVDGESGFLVPVRNAPEIAKRMLTFIENRPLVDRMAEACLIRIRMKFEAMAVANRTADLILGIDPGT